MILIIGLMSTLLLPAFGAGGGAKLRGQAERVAGFLELARQRAVVTGKPHREWIYHMAFQMGRHPIGYDVQRVLSAVDWFKHRRGAQAKVGVVGRGEGGLIALYAAAVFTPSIATAAENHRFVY